MVAAAVLMAPAATVAQAPFDMTPEAGSLPPAPTLPTATPGDSSSAPSGSRPFDVGDGPENPSATPAAPAGATAIAPNDLTRDRPIDAGEVLAEETEIATPERGKIDRYLLSAPTLRFEGETGRRTWGFSLTAEQAARAATLTIAFNSAIYVSPEDSLLRITINERQIVDQPLAARENPTHVDTEIPTGTLRPGINVITFAVDQRHRTDCTILSTYDLWTEFEAEGTGLIFEGEDPTSLASLDDLPAVGLDATGRSRIHLIAPGGERAFAETDLARLVQAIVLRGNFRQAVITVEDGPYDGPPQGILRLAIGTAAELSAVVPGLPPEASAAPTVGFLDAPDAAPTLVISGPAWQDVKAAIGYVADGVGRPIGVARKTIDTTPIILPLVPLLDGDERLTLAQLGIATEEFSGRRFRSQFYVGLPGDFYSDAYGAATLYLDAAYTGEVRPGSHIDVYVNGFIAANTPLTSADGDILQHLPIKVAMTHFRPGVNVIAVDAVLDTETDAICAPGTTAGGPNRFVLFDTSEFFMPTFGRVERWPDLSSLAGAGLPYARSEAPVPMVFGRADAETYGAGLTFLSRVAVSAARVIPVEMGRPDALGTQPAIFVGALGQFSAPTVSELGVADAARTKWDEPVRNPTAVVAVDIDPASIVPNSFGDSTTTEGVYDRWQNELVSPSGIRGRWLEFERWLERNFDLSFASLAIFAGPDAPFDPSDRATLVVVQSPKSAGRPWTMVAGRNTDELVAGVEAITTASFWVGLNGRVAAYNQATGVTSVAPKAERYTFTSGISIDNIRLIAANWMSVNIVAYAIALVLLCCVLGICTSALLGRLGRRS
jgi:hypothetical protein